MIRNSAETATPRKQEGCVEDHDKTTKGTYSLKTWAGLKDPRIVRVSRSFGGKDRHSKVRTSKGLRDRRVRLSVSTAIQLYDLQDRLGLNQPSKVVDWLLKAAEHEIDELPPLPIPQETDFNFPASISNSDLDVDKYSSVQSLSLLGNRSDAKQGAVTAGADEKSNTKLQFSGQDVALRPVQFESSRELSVEKTSLGKRYEQGDQSGPQVHNPQIMNPFHLSHQPSYPSLLINALSSNPYTQRDSSLFLSHLGAQMHSVHSQENNSYSSKSITSSLSLSSGPHLLLYQPIAGQSSNPSFVTNSLELDHSRQFIHPEMLNMSLQSTQSASPLSVPFGNLGQSFRSTYGTVPSNLHHYQHNISHSPDTPEKGKNV